MNLMALILLQCLGVSPVTVLDEDTQDIQGKVSVLEVPARNLDIQDITQRLAEFLPHPEPTQNPNFGLTTSSYWFAFSLKNTLDTENFILTVDYPLLDFIELFEIDPQRQVSKVHPITGDKAPFMNRFIPYRLPNFSIGIPKGESLDLIMRIRTEGSMQVPIRVATSQRFTQLAIDDSAGLWAYYGVMGVLIVLNFFFFIAIRDKVYLTYLGYLITFLLFQMSANGVIFERFLGNYPKANNLSFLILVHLALFFAARFANRFNSVRLHHTGLHRGILAIETLALLGFILATFVPYRNLIGLPILLGILVPGVSIAAGLLAMQRGYRPARFFIVAWSLFLLGVLAYALKSAGVLPTNFATNYGLQIGSALEVVLLTLALGDRMRTTLEERDELSQRIRKQTTILAEQSAKRAEAEARLRVELETKVEILGDAVHHINNPLNHIQGTNEIVSHDIASLHAIIQEAIPPDPDNPDYIEFSSVIAERVIAVQEAVKLSEDAVKRAANAVADVRTLANIDGLALHPIPARDLLRQLQDRFNANPFFKVIHTETELKLIGNPTIYAFVFNAIIHSLHRIYGPEISLRVSIEPIASIPKVRIRLEFIHTGEMTKAEKDELKKALHKLEHVLQNFKALIHLEDDAVVVEVNLKTATNVGPAILKSTTTAESEASTPDSNSSV